VFDAVAIIQIANLASCLRHMPSTVNTLFKAGATQGGVIWFSAADSCRRKKLILGLRRGLSFAISAPRGKVINA